MKPKVLLLGSNGYIGRNLTEIFAHNSDYVLLTPKRLELNLLDEEACKQYLIINKPDFIIHSAVDINSAETSLKLFFNILNHSNKFGQLIQIGSGAEYDRKLCESNVSECDFGRSIPTDSYGIAKYLIARELESHPIGKVVNFRLFGVFGKYEDISRRFISNNIVRVLAGLLITVNQDVIFDYIDVHDFGLFILDYLTGKPLKEISYNFCRGKSLLLSEIAKIIKFQMSVDTSNCFQALLC